MTSRAIDLEHSETSQSPHQVVVPWFVGAVRERHLDLDRVGGRRLGSAVGQVVIQRFENDTAPWTEIPETELQRVEDRGLAAVVLSD